MDLKVNDGISVMNKECFIIWHKKLHDLNLATSSSIAWTSNKPRKMGTNQNQKQSLLSSSDDSWRLTGPIRTWIRPGPPKQHPNLIGQNMRLTLLAHFISYTSTIFYYFLYFLFKISTEVHVVSFTTFLVFKVNTSLSIDPKPRTCIWEVDFLVVTSWW